MRDASLVQPLNCLYESLYLHNKKSLILLFRQESGITSMQNSWYLPRTVCRLCTSMNWITGTSTSQT